MKTKSLISTIILFILLALSPTWAEDVSLSIDSDIPEGTIGHYYTNMPKKETNSLIITEDDINNGKAIFKLYDDGGKNGNHSSYSYGNLNIAVPSGYLIYVTGYVDVETSNSSFGFLKLNNGYKLRGQISYSFNSSNLSVYFNSGYNDTQSYSGLNLTVEITKRSLIVDYEIPEGTAGHYYTIMPNNETRSFAFSEEDLKNCQGSFKIIGTRYNDYSTLNLTAPEGYVFDVQGSIKASYSSDYVRFNDGNKINAQGSNVTTEVSYVSPRNTLKVYSNGIDLEFEVQIKKIVFHGITVTKSDAGGTITADKSTASQNDAVTLTIEPENGYYLQSLTVLSSDGESINVENFDWQSTSTTFVMPNKDVTVNAIFAELQTVSVNSSISGGTVTVDKVKAGATEPVTLTVTPETGYYLKSLTVLTPDEKPIEVEELDWITGVTSFLMPAKDVTINATFGNKGAAYSGYYVNMKSDKTINLDFSNMPVNFSIKLYDDGGKNGWSSKYNQAAKITVPEDCKIKISATIYLGHKYEGLKIYNGLTDNSNNLILSETGPVTNKSIETLTPSNKGYISFDEFSTSNKSNLDLTVTLINENAEYEIETQKASWGFGSITSDKSKAKVGETVTITATPETGYLFDYATVKADKAETRIGNWWSGYTTTFIMPATNVTVTPSFRSASNSLSIDMPKSGTRVVNIQDGIKSFKINSVYYVESNSLDINVPEGHHLELLGKVTKLMDKAKLKIYGINYENNRWTCQNKENYDFSFSSTQSTVTIESYDMGNYYYDGDHPDQFEITVKVVNDNAKSKITVVQSELGGNVTLSPSETDATAAFTETELNNMAVGKNIFARITIPDGYVFDGLEVKDIDENTITVSDHNNQLLEHGYWWESVIGSYPVKFTMPGTDVTITPKFIKGTAEAGVSVDMPNNNTKDVYIPEGIKSINVYDDGGKDGNYRKNSKYALALHAPSGYHFRFSGSINTNTGAWLSINSGSCSAGFNDCCYKNPITDRLTSETYGKWSSIAAVEGPQVTTLYFSSQDGTGELTNAAGLNLKAEIISDNMVMVSFDANGGSGSMDYIELEKGSKYTLPKCTFTAPEGKTTPRWQIGERYYEEGDVVTITASTVIKAAWRTAATLSVNQYSYWTYGESPRKPELQSYNGDATVTYEYYRYEDSNKIKTTFENSGADTDGGIPKKAGRYYVKVIAAMTDLYGPAEVEKQFTINPRALIINGLSAENKTYDGSTTATISGTAVLQGVINNDDVSVVVGSANFADPNVGTGKAVTFSGFTLSGADASNYELTKTSLPTDVTANITKAPLTITAKNKTITYGDEPSNAGVEFSGFVNEENEKSLSGVLSYSYGYTQYGNVGEYTITPSGLTADNYEINFVDGKLTVEPKSVSVTWDKQNTFTYDGAEHAPTATLEGVLDGDVYKLTVTGAEKNVGKYTAIATVVCNDNYKQPKSGLEQDFEITKAPLTVTAKNKAITYGDEPANDGIEYAGFIGKENASVLRGTLAFEYNYEKGNKTGEYSITPSGLTADNYEITFVNGKLTVEPKSVSVTWDKQNTFTYDGAEHAPTATIEGVLESDKCSFTVSGAEKNAGKYTATVTELDNANYKLPESGLKQDFEITKAPLTITAKNKAITYGDEPANDGIEYAGFIGKEDASVLRGTLAFEYNYEKGNKTGEYSITPSGLTADNYEITFVDGKLTVALKKTVFAAVQIVEDENGKRAIINDAGEETLNIPEAITVDAIEYNRTLEPLTPASAVLPFTLPKGTTVNAEFYTLGEVKQVGRSWKAVMEYIGDGKLPKANTPYAVILNEGAEKLEFDMHGGKATVQTGEIKKNWDATEKWYFTGTYAYKKWDEKNNANEIGLVYGFAGTNEYGIAKGGFGKVEAGAEASPMVAYLRKKDASVQLETAPKKLNRSGASFINAYNINLMPETIDVEFVKDGSEGKKTTGWARYNTATGEFRMIRRATYDLKGRRVNDANRASKGMYLKK